ncbi:MAG: lipid IV(A) 3-deoxy-D-manno-octulosonic acid transferase [Aquisalimonadaceae bacterium]
MTTQRRQLWLAGGPGAVRRQAAWSPPDAGAVAGDGRWLQVLYSCLLYLTMPLWLLHLLLSARRHGGYVRRVHERFGLVDSRLRGHGCIWIHAVSVGEVQAALPLVQSLRRSYPGRPILLTTTTPTGSDTVRRLLGEQVTHTYLPWDLPGAVERFLARVQPAAAIILETELWPNLFSACGRRPIPLLLVSARLSAGSARRYGRLRPLIRRTLRQCTRILARSPEDAQRFAALGAPVERLQVGGNLKFDYRVPDDQVQAAQALSREAQGRKVWVAACTHAGEESVVLEVHKRLRMQYPQLLLVLVPRHPERFQRIAAMCIARGLAVSRRSTGTHVVPETAVLLGDTMGELPLYYAMSDAAFIGGSMVPVGGHNPVEAAAQGVAMVIGPRTFKITDTLRLFQEADAITQVPDAGALADALARLFRDPEMARQQGARARRLVISGRGATAAAVAEVCEQLPPPAQARSADA